MGGAFTSGAFGAEETGNVSLAAATYFGTGATDVEYPMYQHVIDAAGNRVQDSENNWVYDSNKPFYILDGNGERQKDANDGYIMRSFRRPWMLDSRGNILFDADDNPILETNWRKHLVAGVATPLVSYSVTGISWVVVQAKPSNLGKIYVAGDTAQLRRGTYLPPGVSFVGSIMVPTPCPPYAIPSIDDLAKVYIIGNAGEGVTFTFGGDDSFSRIIDQVGNFVINRDSGHVMGEG